MCSYMLYAPFDCDDQRELRCAFLRSVFLCVCVGWEPKVKKQNYSNREHVHSAPYCPTSKTTQERQKIHERKRQRLAPESLMGTLFSFSWFFFSLGGPKWLFIISVGSKPFFSLSTLDCCVCVHCVCVCVRCVCVVCRRFLCVCVFLLVKPMMPGLPTNYISVCLCIV